MKRIVSILLVAIMLITIGAITASAQTEEKGHLYEDKFVEYEVEPLPYASMGYYRETYYHYDAEGNIDWAFIEVPVYPAEQQFSTAIFCGKYVENSMNCLVFSLGIGIYDVKADEFREASNYKNLELDGFEEYVWENIGEFMGDADADGELTVLDATFIQQALVGIREFLPNDYKFTIPKPLYISDYDQDGQRSVMDATAIQMKLAGIE
ncbi:MAG: dockerin type I repeat-containing protein [Ruminococcus sp.]|nr:dockerin type I repeat-containing protein [Ruminococcus sp.]